MTATTVAASRPQSNKQSLWRRFVKGRGLSYCVLAVIGVFWIFPFLWMALGSLKTQREILAKPPKLLPEHASLANFAKWFGELNFGTYFTNSMVVAVSSGTWCSAPWSDTPWRRWTSPARTSCSAPSW